MRGRTGRDDTRDGKHIVISLQKLWCVFMKLGRFSSHPRKAGSCLRQTRSRQRRDKNLHVNALPRDDFENDASVLIIRLIVSSEYVYE